MYILLIGILELIFISMIFFYTISLPGTPKTPSGDDSGVIKSHQLRQLCPDLKEHYYNLFQHAVHQHLLGNFDLAVRLYLRVQNVELNSGQSIDVFKTVPEVEMNYFLAKAHRKSR